MFDRQALTRVIDLQERSYRLLKWTNAALQRKIVSFDTIHESLSLAEAAAEWISRHFENIPPEARPERAQLREFAQLYSSYLATSFELVKQPRIRAVSPCGCYCAYCTYFAVGSNLKIRRITSAARRDAAELKRLYVCALTGQLNLAFAGREQALLEEQSLAADVSWATYGRELLRRSEFASQGPGVLVLWREIAWTDPRQGAMKPDFALTAERILTAERRLVDFFQKST